MCRDSSTSAARSSLKHFGLEKPRTLPNVFSDKDNSLRFLLMRLTPIRSDAVLFSSTFGDEPQNLERNCHSQLAALDAHYEASVHDVFVNFAVFCTNLNEQSINSDIAEPMA